MNASEAIKRIQEALDEAEKTGLTAIPVENLRNYLAQLASAATTDSEADSNRFEAWKTQFAAEAAHSVEMFKSVVEAGQTALKSAILINGGAAGILFSFAASAMAKWDIKPGTPILTEIGHALLAFMVGVGAAGTATGFRYLSQFSYSGKAGKVSGVAGLISNIISIALGITSFALFFYGGFLAYRTLV